MKQPILTLLVAIFALSSITAQVTKTINVTSAGTLTSLLTFEEKSTITNLTVTGNINAIDFKCMRDELTVLSELNLTLSNIVSYTGSEGPISPTSTTYPSNELPQYSFQNKSSLKSFIYPSKISSIGSYAFKNCSGLSGVLNIPTTVISLKLGAFDNCTNITSVIIPNSVQIIEGCAFIRCSGLVGTLSIPKSVVWIGAYAFKNTGNSDFMVDPENQYFSSVNGVLFDKNQTRLVKYPTNKIGTYIIPNTVTTIGISAFASCDNLIGEVVFPNSITSIESSAFENCTKISGKINLPKSITSIADFSFSGCTSINTLIIPEKVTTIGQYAFYYCIGLKTINTQAKVPPLIYETSFYLVFANQVEVPIGTKNAYQTSLGWMNFSNYIEIATGIKQQIISNFKIYPNPATDYIDISGLLELTKVEVYNLSGKLFKSNKLSSESNRIDISTLPKGVYLIKGFTEGRVKVGRFVKE